MPQDKPIAITIASLNQFGCPYCGYRSGTTPMSFGATVLWQCSECGKSCCALADGTTKSSIRVGDIYPELERHPRHGMPSHGTPDLKPGGGGEFFRSRGIGLDSCACFVCGAQQNRNERGSVFLNNIAAFAQCKEAGERVVAMFPQGARLDYREHEPDRVQVKIGACDLHLPHLQKLDLLVQDGIISENRIATARE